MKKTLTLISWNINGIRAAIRKGFGEFLQTKKPDIICLQEVKIDDVMRARENFDFPDYEEYWNSADRPGYSGTATFIKSSLKLKPKYTTGVGVEKFDTEGRTQTLEFDKFYLVNIYFPNTRRDLSRLDFKIEFNNALLKHVKKLEKSKPVIITGDLNVAHEEIDLARPKENDGNAGFHPEERKWMTKFLGSGFIDTFRFLHPKTIKYSWWTYRSFARKRNVGWRIDYFCVSERLKNKIKKAEIWNDIDGSDHCPVMLKINL